MPFLAVSCRSLPHHTESGTQPTTLTSWLDATLGGTLFIDDLPHMPEGLQQQVATVLDHDHRTADLRGTRLTRARIITGADPQWAATFDATGFCPRLFYRLNAIHIAKYT